MQLAGILIMQKLHGFVAYPSTPYQLASEITEAISSVNHRGGNTFIGWEENDISGRPLTNPIFQNIQSANLLIADVTKLNFNVTYEIGYAIGIGRRAYLIRNNTFTSDNEEIRKIGIFDTLGYETYDNAKQLADLLASITDATPLTTASPPNRNTPVYILETPIRSGVLTHIVARVKKARLQYRSFVPAEEVRLSAIDAITHVASSFGVLIPLLSSGMSGWEIHNIRAAFVAGLAHGMSKHTLILQDQDGPVPLDVRDFSKRYSHPSDIDSHIHDFSLDVYETTQQIDDSRLPEGNFLSKITIGDPLAENEFQTLSQYYLQTDEFGRAIRGEVNLVVGRKGTGKTALFSQVRNRKRGNRANVVVDLKPEGYQLVKLKEEVLDYLSAGAKAHLITAFWEYLLYLEICYKLLEKDQERHLRDPNLYEDYIALQKLYASPIVSQGDFSERLLALSQNLSQEYTAAHGTQEGVRLTADEVTAFIHSHNIRDLRIQLSRYLRHKEETWILFDNLDKGWAPQGLASGDIVILRCLIDASRRIQREMSRDDQDLHVIVFIRNDVYQLLMDESPDFGKESRASLDWSDDSLLREMLRRRLVQNIGSKDATFDQIWSRVCVSLYKGDETSQYLIDRSLMRPRNLLKLFNSCRGFAVNHQHDRIYADDIEKGLKAYSNDMIVEADQELTDIEPGAKKLIYQFLGENSEFTNDDLTILLDINNIKPEKHAKVIEFLLYYGFLGIKYLDQDTQYIFHVGYDMELLRTRITKNREAIRYVLNPVFWPALEISATNL